MFWFVCKYILLLELHSNRFALVSFFNGSHVYDKLFLINSTLSQKLKLKQLKGASYTKLKDFHFENLKFYSRKEHSIGFMIEVY